MKSIKTFFYALGGYYAISMLLTYAGFGMQKMIYEHDHHFDQFVDSLDSIQAAVLKYAPGFFIIGILHIIYGYFFERITKQRLTLFILLSIAAVICFLFQFINTYPEFEKLFDSIPGHLDWMDDLKNFSLISGIIFGVAQVTVPQFFLGRMIYKLDKEQQENLS